jgi:hypothetical protein
LPGDFKARTAVLVTCVTPVTGKRLESARQAAPEKPSKLKERKMVGAVRFELTTF